MADNPFKYYGFYGWKGNESVDFRNHTARLQSAVKSETKYIHDVDLTIIDHLRSVWDKGSHYASVNNLTFVPYNKNCSPEDATITQELILSKYNKYSNNINENILWIKIMEQRYAQYRGYSKEMSETIINNASKNAINKLIEIYEKPFVDVEKILRDKFDQNTLNKNELEIYKVARRTCKDFASIKGISSNEFPPNAKITNRQLLLSRLVFRQLMEARGDYDDRIIADPFQFASTIDENYSFTWGVYMNKAFLHCFLNSSTHPAPFLLILGGHPEELLFKSTVKNFSTRKYLGFFILRYDSDYANNFAQKNDTIFKNMDIHEYNDIFDKKPHPSAANYYIFFIFKKSGTTATSSAAFYEMYSIINFRCNYISWGDITESRTYLYYEIRQIMCMQKNKDIRVYAIVEKLAQKRKFSTPSDVKHMCTIKDTRCWWESLNDYGNTIGLTYTTGELHILCCKNDLDPEYLKTSYPNCDAVEINFVYSDRSKLLYNTDYDNGEIIIAKKSNRKHDDNNLCIDDKYITNLYMRDIELFTFYHQKLKNTYNTFEHGLTGGNDILQTLISKYNKNIKGLQAYTKELEHFYKSNDYKLENKDITSTVGIKGQPRSYVVQGDILYYNGVKVNDKNFVIPNSKFVMGTLIQPIKPKSKVLCISVNGHYGEAVLLSENTCIVDLFIINLHNVGNYIKLASKYKNIRLIIGLMELDKNIFNYISDKYDIIIIDMGYNKYNSTSIANTLDQFTNYLENNATLYVYSLLPTTPDDLLLKTITNMYPKFAYLKSSYDDEIANKNQLLFNSSGTNIVYQLINYGKSGNKDKFNNLLIDSWNTLSIHTKYLLDNVKNIKTGGAKNLYQWGRNLSNRMRLPTITVDDLPKYNYNERARDFQPRCHWGQMKLLMSEIQFLNHVALDKSINHKKTLITYAGAAGGEHLEYLYSIYPDYDWLLIDPGSFSKAAANHPRRGAVKIRNEFFLDSTIKTIPSGYETYLFISDIRVDTKEELVMKDMIKQAEWSMMMNAKHSLFKFRLPYTNENDDNLIKLPIDHTSYNYDKKLMKCPKEKAGKNEIMYLDGILNLQIFPPIHSTELRLITSRNKDGSYPFKIYNYKDIEDKLFFYNNVLRMNYRVTDDLAEINDIPLKELMDIKGFDDGYESYMIYKAMDDYQKVSGSKKNSVVLVKDLFTTMERITQRDPTTCVIHTYNHVLKSRNYTSEEQDRIKLWIQIIKHLQSGSKDLLEIAQDGKLVPYHPVQKTKTQTRSSSKNPIKRSSRKINGRSRRKSNK